tara:strand:+ start:2085 stop:2363 length:279 start_codon:yes stop_codon:yes gene_type:complete
MKLLKSHYININMYKIIILIILLLTTCLFIYPLFKSREGLESHTDCLKQGYPNEFCLNVPQQAMTNGDLYDIYQEPDYKPFIDENSDIYLNV